MSQFYLVIEGAISPIALFKVFKVFASATTWLCSVWPPGKFQTCMLDNIRLDFKIPLVALANTL
jgi:hypothetical protein